jgi:single-strand DNA-binding protein
MKEVTLLARFRDAFAWPGRYVDLAVNSVSLIGNLAGGVEVKELGEGRRVASFVVAVDRAGRFGGVDFVRVAVWNKQAEACARSLSKGEQIGVDGRLRSRSWDDAEGRRHTALEVVANHVEFLGRPTSAAAVSDPEAAMD